MLSKTSGLERRRHRELDSGKLPNRRVTYSTRLPIAQILIPMSRHPQSRVLGVAICSPTDLEERRRELNLPWARNERSHSAQLSFYLARSGSFLQLDVTSSALSLIEHNAPGCIASCTPLTLVLLEHMSALARMASHRCLLRQCVSLLHGICCDHSQRTEVGTSRLGERKMAKCTPLLS